MKKLESCTLNEALNYIKYNTPTDIVSEDNSFKKNEIGEEVSLSYVVIDKDNIKHTYILTPTKNNKFDLSYEVDSVYDNNVCDDLDFI